MYRYLTALLVLVCLMAGSGQTQAQQIKRVSGYIPSGTTWYFYPRVPQNSLLDTIYQISGPLDVAGKLLIAEGAEVWMLPNSRLVDSAGGKIIANGFATIPGFPNFNRRILFRGSSQGDTSFEWGHIDILPNSDSAFFSNVRFTNFRKRNNVDSTNIIYNAIFDPAHAAFNFAINSAMNGRGGAITTFSQKTYIYDAIVDSCRASFAGGAFAFLQAPAGWPVPDDGRLALKNKQVALLTIRDTRVYNNETSAPTNALALGGAIYMASNSSGYLIADSVVGYLGHNLVVTGTPGAPDTIKPLQDIMLFERCTANNTFSNASNFAKGGAIYVGTNTGLILSQCTFNNDSAIETIDGNSWGGAIAVSAYSGSPNENYPALTGGAGDAMPGLVINKTATFAGNVAGIGGAIQIDNPAPILGVKVPRLVINAEPIVFLPGVIGPVLDSGLIQFNGNIAYNFGGAIYSQNQVYIEGYLAPQGFPWPGGPYAVELRVKFFNNVAGQGGGSVFLDGAFGGTPDLIERRSWHLQNSVNPFDPRLNPAGGPNRGSLYGLMVLGGGAEYVGLRDSTFSTEYNSNLVVGGNGGGVAIVDDIASANQVPINRFFGENEFNARNPMVPRDTQTTPTGAPAYSIFPFDQRELTRFINNNALLGPDSAALFSYDPTNLLSAHGRGGGLFILITNTASNIAFDSTILSRVRIEHNEAFSGSAIWSDCYDLKIMSNQSLIANNLATSRASATVDLDSSGVANPGDPNAGATIWADFEGPLPSYAYNSHTDAIYDNTARYVVRLPVSQVRGVSGVDTMRGNFWGETGPAIITEERPPTGVEQQTFFVDFYKGCYTNIYEPNSQPPISYQPMTVGQPVPDTDLMEGRVYDLYDRGTDMKTADYSNRRLAPSEAFALGLPANMTKMHRFTRNLFDTNSVYVNKIDQYQTDFVGPHPLGYPLFLQADVPFNFNNMALTDSNYDPNARNYTTFIVLNQTTNEFVRVNLRETKASEGASDNQQTYQGRLDFVPDSSGNPSLPNNERRHPNLRSTTLYTLSLLRPQVLTYAEVQRASLLEDSAALHGREYSLSPSDLVPAGDTTDAIAMDCESGGPATGTWYAGEKYHTLPVRPGDQILVISRTQLWKYGSAFAIANGLQFVIGDVLAPSFVGDIPNLQSNPYTPNVRFVKRDSNYDGHNAASTLFRVAGYDPNAFYDPRYLFNPYNYTQLAFTVKPDLFKGDVVPTGPGYVPANALDSVEAHVRLFHGTLFHTANDNWLYDSVVFNQNITGSNGYIELKGQPRNPDIVPGGESLTATVTNWPPNFASEDSLLTEPFLLPGALGPDSKSLSMWVFPPYMNCARNPDSTTAIPDTICVRATTTTYHFTIIVKDSLPVFDTVPKSACGYSTPVGILTDSLRYSLDLNTDVEREDSIAAAETLPGATTNDTLNHRTYPAWDFRYGRTSYRFVTWPSWMSEPRGGVYVAVDSTDPNFLLKGILNIRIDSISAVGGNSNNATFLQTQPPAPVDPSNPNEGFQLNLDTIAAIEANDGHTGKTVINFPVTVIFAPTILTNTLPDAKEGIDYSLNFQQPTDIQRILAQNRNPDHPFTYTLLYHGDTEMLFRDHPNRVPLAPFTGTHAVGGAQAQDTVLGFTPRWLHIDPYSGVLTGVPGDTDAPKIAGTPCGGDTVTVIVSDGTYPTYCVAAWTNILLNVDSVNHAPEFVKGPAPICVLNDSTFCDTVLVVDRDLLRNSCEPETIVVGSVGTSTDPNVTANVTINGVTTLTKPGQLPSDTVNLLVCATIHEPNTYFNTLPLAPYIVELVVTDAAGLVDTIRYPVHIGELPVFECTINVMNAVTPLHPLQDIQKLCFGVGNSATDGIDQQYCEYELAPPPPLSAFDARWILPVGGTVEGTTIDIRANGAPALITWQVEFQPGDNGGVAGSLYPVEICWRPSCLDPTVLAAPYSQGHFYLRDPQSEQEFSIDMFLGQGPIDNSLYTLQKVNGDSDCLQIRNNTLTSAYIAFEPAGSGVGTQPTAQFSLQPNHPNPFAGATTLSFSLAERSTVRIDIYDVKGTLIRTIANEVDDAGGPYPITWDGTDASGAPAPDGTYIASMKAGSFSTSVKMSLEHGSQQ